MVSKLGRQFCVWPLIALLGVCSLSRAQDFFGDVPEVKERFPAEPTTRPDAPAAPASTGTRYIRIPVHGVIGVDFTAATMERYLRWASEVRPDYVVLEIDSPGGRVASAERIVDLLIENRRNLRYVAHVRRALSAAAAVTLTCPEVYVTETATIGAAVSYRQTLDGLPAEVAEKFQSAWRATCRKAAEAGGHSSLLAEAMVDPAFALTLRQEGGTPVLERNGRGEVLKARDRILTLTPKEAMACGLARRVADDFKALGLILSPSVPWEEAAPPKVPEAPRVAPAPEAEGALALHQMVLAKVIELKVWDASLTELQRQNAIVEWKRWFDEQGFPNREVTWTLRLDEASADLAKNEIETLRNSLDRAKHRLQKAEENYSRVQRDRRSTRRDHIDARARIDDAKKEVERVGRQYREAAKYPYFALCSAGEDAEVFVVARLEEAAAGPLLDVSRGGEIRLRGTISMLEFSGGWATHVLLNPCTVVPADAPAPAPPPAANADEPDEETRAKGKLALAETYERNRMTDAARKAYQEILTDYPKTAAAATARVRLARLGQ